MFKYILAGALALGTVLYSSEVNGFVRPQISEIVMEGELYVDQKQRTCLALAVFHEGRNQSVEGQIAIATVVLNRVMANFKSSICEVVFDGCQFSWVCDSSKQYDPGKLRNKREFDAWVFANLLANDFILEYNSKSFVDITLGATFYHTKFINPNWSRRLERTVIIDDHIFYRIRSL